MIAAMVAGGGLGIALCALAWTLIPARVDHVAVLGRIDAARHPVVLDSGVVTDATGRFSGLRDRAGTRINAALTRRGIQAISLRRDLAIADRGVNDFLGGLVLTAMAWFVGALLAATLTAVAGGPVPPVAVLPAAVLIAALMVYARVHDAHKFAEQRRREFRRALSVYLDLVAMSVLGGTGLPEALPTVASIGKGWPFRLLSETVTEARDVSGPLAAARALGEMGQRIGISELIDLSIALDLSGEQGARISKTLIERAKTLRARDIADVQARAEERGASMDLPRVGIGFGFLIFVIYPLVVVVVRR